MALAIVTSGSALDESPGAPMWWVRRLHQRILDRRSGLLKIKRYYKGDFPWRYADKKLRQAFGPVFYDTRFGVNWMKLIVAGVQERLQIDGIRIGNSSESDKGAWDIWQAANMDARSAKVHHISLLYGASYVTVWTSDDNKQPAIKIDHPAMAAVELDPDDELARLAGLRLYMDVAGFLHAQLFLPDTVYLFRSPAPISNQRGTAQETQSMTWAVDDQVIEQGQMDNPFGVVPMVPFTNTPAAEWPGEGDGRWLMERSELYGVMPIQDALNSALLNAILIANQQGYRQRWVTGLDIETDDEGRPKQPFVAGLERLWQAENKDTKFGEFQPTDLTSLINFIDQLVRQLAAATQIPPHYLEPRADRLSADSIRAAESGLISKIRHKQLFYGDDWEEVMRLCGVYAGNSELATANAAEVIWHDPETHTIAQLYDAALKSTQIGIPWPTRMRFLQYTPQEIERMEQERAEDALLSVNPDILTMEQIRLTGQAPGEGPAQPPKPWSTPVPPTTTE